MASRSETGSRSRVESSSGPRASLARASLLARRLAALTDENAIARALGDAVRRLVPVTRAWVLLLQESSEELHEVVRVPDSAGGARLVLSWSDFAPWQAATARAGVLLHHAPHAALHALGPLGAVRAEMPDATLCAFAPHGAVGPPELLLLLAWPRTERVGVAARSAVQLATDAVGHALERRRLSARVGLYRSDAERDFLTGVFNRRLTLRLLEREIHKSQRSKGPLSLVMVDVDQFKSFNDVYGHLAGDDVLRSLAQLFVASARASDVVGRFGGEEFLVVLPDTGVEDAVLFVERLRQDVERFGRENLTLFRDHALTISIGVCAVGGRDSLDSALARADRALYESKHRGRNCFSLEVPEEVRS
jgi:diguanylate cyclase (GGDEF)-like protein